MSSLIKKRKGIPQRKVKALKLAQNDVIEIRSASRVLKQGQGTENPEIAALKAENINLEEQLEQIKISSRDAVEKAKIEAKQQAKADIKQDFSKAYDKLGMAIDKAIGKLEDQLASSEALALLVAQTALEKVFHPDTDYKQLTSRIIKKQVQDLRRETILKVRVSGQDFQDDEALEDLAFALDLRQADIKISQKLRAGDCTIDLRLGHMELSVKNQWEDLQRLFKDMAMDEGLS